MGIFKKVIHTKCDSGDTKCSLFISQAFQPPSRNACGECGSISIKRFYGTNWSPIFVVISATSVLAIWLIYSLLKPLLPPPCCVPEYKEYKNSEFGLTMKYPTNWKVEEKPERVLGTIVTFLPLQDETSCNLSLGFEDLTNQISFPITLEKYTSSVYSEINKFLPAGRLIDGKNSILAQRPAFEVNYVTDENSVKIKRSQVWTIIDKHAYIVTHTAKEQEFETCLKTVNPMIESINIAKE